MESNSGESSHPKPVPHHTSPLKVSQPTAKASVAEGLLVEVVAGSEAMGVTIPSRVNPVDRLHGAVVQDMITKT